MIAILIKLEWPENLWLEPLAADATERSLKPWVPWLGAGTSAAAAVTALVAPIKGGLTSQQTKAQLSNAQAQLHLAGLTNTVFAAIAEGRGDARRSLDLWEHMTVRAYCVDGSSDTEHLKLVAEARNHRRTSTGISWKIGKGTVGLAWRDRKRLILNLKSSSYLAALSSERTWDASSEQIRQNLTYVEAMKLSEQPYGAVAAYPVADRESVYGIVAVDVPPGHVTFLKQEQITRHVERQLAYSTPDFRALWEQLQK